MSAAVPRLILLVLILLICAIFIGDLVKNIIQGKRKIAIIKISAISAIILAMRVLLNLSVADKLSVPMGYKYDSKYVINFNKVMKSNSGTKVKINKVYLDLKYVSLTMGVKGKDKLVAYELKKNLQDEKPVAKMQGCWLGGRWSYEYTGSGIPYKEEGFIDPLYVVCYLSNGEELIFEIKDTKGVKSKTEFIKIDKTIEHEGRKLVIENMTRAMNYTSVSAKANGRFWDMEVSILNNDIESEKIPGSWNGGGSTYYYDFYFKPIKDGKITLKIAMKDSDKVYLVDVK